MTCMKTELVQRATRSGIRGFLKHPIVFILGHSWRRDRNSCPWAGTLLWIAVLFCFVRARASPLSVSPPAAGCLLPGRPEAVLSGFLLSPWMRCLLYMKWPLNHRKCVEYS